MLDLIIKLKYLSFKDKDVTTELFKYRSKTDHMS